MRPHGIVALEPGDAELNCVVDFIPVRRLHGVVHRDVDVLGNGISHGHLHQHHSGGHGDAVDWLHGIHDAFKHEHSSLDPAADVGHLLRHVRP